MDKWRRAIAERDICLPASCGRVCLCNRTRECRCCCEESREVFVFTGAKNRHRSQLRFHDFRRFNRVKAFGLVTVPPKRGGSGRKWVTAD